MEEEASASLGNHRPGTAPFERNGRIPLLARRAALAPALMPKRGAGGDDASRITRFDVHELGRLLYQATWGSHVRAEDVFREANESVAAKAGELKFAHPLPFLCECRDRHCFARISLTLEEYEQVRSDPRRFLTIPGHETGAA